MNLEDNPKSLQPLVGEHVYQTWVGMLGSLVPRGRTHRLSTVVAAMLRYSADLAFSQYGAKAQEGTAAYDVICAEEECAPEDVYRCIGDYVERLFKDAGVKYNRMSSRGEKYSIAYDAVLEFASWYDMPRE